MQDTSKVISFIGAHAGVGNSALVRAFVTDAAQSLRCIVIDFDASSASTCDWAIRRHKNGFAPSIPVERGDMLGSVAQNTVTELVVVDASGSSKPSSINLALMSRLVVISSRADPENIAGVIEHMKAFSDAGLTDRVVVALCRVQLGAAAAAARRTLAANGVSVLTGEIREDRMRYPSLEREGRSLCEGPRRWLVESESLLIDSIQKAFIDRDRTEESDR